MSNTIRCILRLCKIGPLLYHFIIEGKVCLFIYWYMVCYLVLICWTLVFLAFVAFIGSNSPLWLKLIPFLLLHSVSERLQLALSSSGELKDLFSPIRLSGCSSDERFLWHAAWVWVSPNDSLRVIRSSLGFVAMWNENSIQKSKRHWIDSTNQFFGKCAYQQSFRMNTYQV